MKSLFTLLLFLQFSLINISFNNSELYSQERDQSRTQKIEQDGKIATQTIPDKKVIPSESLNDHLYGVKHTTESEKFILDGSVIWSAQDPTAIANVVAVDELASSDLTGWGLNSMRATLYSDANNTPIWDFMTGSYDPYVDISNDGSKVAVTAGTDFYLLDPTNGNINFQFTMPDSLYASIVKVSRDGSMAIVLANALGGSTTYRAYAFDLTGATPTVSWTFDVDVSEIANWAGANFTVDNSRVAVTGRNHLYIFNQIDGTLIWDHFVDNTESAPAISGDGAVVVTADNSGFVQTWHADAGTNDYFLLWQYRVPVGTSTNWASSVGISADGNTIVAGSLIFLSSGYEGSVMCFDTYGNGTPKWVFANAGDLVDDIKLSDDGKVAAAVTWGDLAHTRPDLLVFDTQTGTLTFDVVSPGSFFTCDLTPDGSKVFAGGKAVHAREFGNGGRIYLCEIDLGGGNISGSVDLTNSGDDSGVLVTAVGTVRSAVTDLSGNYIIGNVPAGTYTVKAEKPGYNFGNVTNVAVTNGNTTSGVDFALNPFSTSPPTLIASTNLVGHILLSWSTLVNNTLREKELAMMVGDINYFDGFESTQTKSIISHSDNSDEQIYFSPFILADSIAIYRSLVSEGPYQKIASVPISQSSYADSSVFALRDYYYVVNIVNEIGQSNYSNEAVGMVSDTLLTFSLDVPEATVPTIDGIITPGEWDDAFQLDISDIFGYGGGTPKPQGSVIMYLKFDDATDMLYVAGEDFLNPTLDDNEGFGLYFDDNNNDVFDAEPPFVLEGNFWAYWHPTGSDLRFRTIPGYVITTLQGALVNFSDASGHLQGEFAIPMGFLEGYELQVFGPDKIVGLGAFLIARNAGAAVFNGWWPQTMNTVFNPQYFGDVGIDVSLLAPPQAPQNITVTRQGQDLLLTWDDPTLGINNDPLTVSPTINVYKNGEFLTTFSTGVESFLDNDVYCVAWYEYQMQAFIVVGSDILTGPMSSPIGEYACEEPVLVPISYDDGNWNGFYVASFSWEENKFGIRFTPNSFPTYVRRLETIVNGNEPFDFTIHKDNGGIPGELIVGPYRVQDMSPATVGTIVKNIPGIDPPEIAQGDFWVVINWLETSPGAPGIGADIDPPIDNRSMYYLTSSGWVAIPGVDIMVTAYVSDQPVNVENENEANIPISFDLSQNYPNPFNPSTLISFQIPESEFVSLEIYNALGEKVRTLVNETKNAGKYEVTWDGKSNSGNQLASGIYIYRLKAGNNLKVLKMVLLK